MIKQEEREQVIKRLAAAGNLQSLRVVMSQRQRGAETELTRWGMHQLEQLGVPFSFAWKATDIALSRNMALSAAVRDAKSTERYVLMLDDDIAFSLADVLDCYEALQIQPFAWRPLGDAALRQTGFNVPVAKIYMNADGTGAGVRCRPDRWLTGLGFVMVELGFLKLLAAESQSFINYDGHLTYAFAQSGMIGKRWHSEDFWLTRRFGGVSLVGKVGHVKPIPISPDAESMARFLTPNPDGPFFGDLGSDDFPSPAVPQAVGRLSAAQSDAPESPQRGACVA